MNNDVFFKIFVAVIFLITSLYSLIVAISFLRGKNLENTNTYKFGEIISRVVQGKEKASKISEDLNDPTNSSKYGIMFLSFSIIFLFLAGIVLFG